MTEHERARRIGELRINLMLWSTPGFDRVMKDLADYTGPELPIDENIKFLKKKYSVELKALEDNIDSKYKQGELGL